MEKQLCVVCQCKKCGHLMYLSINDKIMDKIKKIEKYECDNCGEEGYENWILRGIDDWNDRKVR